MKEGSTKPNYCKRLKQRIMRRTPSMVGDSVGAGAGALVGFSLGGPLAAIWGAAIGSAISGEVSDIFQRELSKQERTRIDKLTEYIFKKIENNCDAGLKPRSDDFIHDGPTSRSSAKEIVEGLYISAKSDHEEKKLPYYGNLLVNILFMPEIDRFQADFLVRLLKNLSYRQFCIIALATHKDEFKLKEGGYKGGYYDDKLVFVLQEMHELYSQRLLGPFGSNIFGFETVSPVNMAIEGVGETIYELAELDDLYRNDYDELKRTAELLK